MTLFSTTIGAKKNESFPNQCASGYIKNISSTSTASFTVLSEGMATLNKTLAPLQSFNFTNLYIYKISNLSSTALEVVFSDSTTFSASEAPYAFSQVGTFSVIALGVTDIAIAQISSSVVFNVTGAVAITGGVSISAGTVDIGNTVNILGAVSISAGTVNVAGTVSIAGVVSITGNVNVTASGTVDIGNTVNIVGAVSISAGTVNIGNTVNITGAVSITSGSITITSGTVNIGNTVNILGSVSISAGTVSISGTVSIAGVVSITGNVDVTASGTVNIGNTVNITGAVNINAGTVTIGNTVNISGTVSISDITAGNITLNATTNNIGAINISTYKKIYAEKIVTTQIPANATGNNEIGTLTVPAGQIYGITRIGANIPPSANVANGFLVQILNTVSGKITEVLMYASNVVENSYVSAGVGNGNYAGQSFNFGGVGGNPSAFYGFNWSSIPIMLPNEELQIYFGYSSNYPSAFNITIVIDYYAEAISSTISG